MFSDGLKKALYNYMHGIGIDFPLKKFFSFAIPEPLVPRTLIERSLKATPLDEVSKTGFRFCFLQNTLVMKKQNGGNKEVEIIGSKGKDTIEIPMHAAQFLVDHQYQFQWNAKNEWDYTTTIEKLASLCKKTTDELVQQKWWKSLRRFFIVIKA
jgi:hypothetical protein